MQHVAAPNLFCGRRSSLALSRLALRAQGWWEESSWDEPKAASDWGAAPGASEWDGGGDGAFGGGERDGMATLAAEMDAMLQVQEMESALARQQRELAHEQHTRARAAPPGGVACTATDDDAAVVHTPPPTCGDTADALPAFFVVAEAEPSSSRRADVGVSEERVEQLLEEYKRAEEAEGGSSIDLAAVEDGMKWAGEVYEYEPDRGFGKFSKRMQRSPLQCVRSAWGGALLWPAKRLPKLQRCSQCGVRLGEAPRWERTMRNQGGVRLALVRPVTYTLPRLGP